MTNHGGVAAIPGNTLAIDNPSGVTANRFLAWNLKLINGVVTVPDPSDYFRVPGTVIRVNGYIDGNLSRDVDTHGTYTFDVGTANGYSPVTVQVTAGHDFPAGMLVRAVQSAQPNIQDPSRALSRYWQVFGGPNITAANLTFDYLDPPDVPTSANESKFVIQRYRNGFTQPSGNIDTQANIFRLTGLSDFYSLTDWTLAEPGALGTSTPTDTPTNTPTTTPTNSPTATSTPTATATSTATATTTGSPACTPGTLYDQTDNAAVTVTSSQNFEAALDGYDDQVADDFVVPAGQTWNISQVNVAGQYFSGIGQADSVNVFVYPNSGTLPGATAVCTYNNVSIASGAATGAFEHKTAVRLCAE